MRCPECQYNDSECRCPENNAYKKMKEKKDTKIAELEGALWTEQELNRQHLETIDQQKKLIEELQRTIKLNEKLDSIKRKDTFPVDCIWESKPDYKVVKITKEEYLTLELEQYYEKFGGILEDMCNGWYYNEVELDEDIVFTGNYYGLIKV